jgi:L-asparaginase
MNGLNDANKAGVKVVIATQTGNGRVIRNRRFSEQRYIVADNLTPKKARILLMLGLTVTDDSEELQRMMNTY